MVAEDRAVEARTNDLLVDWEHSKPIEGRLRPDEALQQLTEFEVKFSRLKEERDNVAKAKEALELQYTGKIFLQRLLNCCNMIYLFIYIYYIVLFRDNYLLRNLRRENLVTLV